MSKSTCGSMRKTRVRTGGVVPVALGVVITLSEGTRFMMKCANTDTRKR